MPATKRKKGPKVYSREELLENLVLSELPLRRWPNLLNPEAATNSAADAQPECKIPNAANAPEEEPVDPQLPAASSPLHKRQGNDAGYSLARGKGLYCKNQSHPKRAADQPRAEHVMQVMGDGMSHTAMGIPRLVLAVILPTPVGIECLIMTLHVV